jgi:hypothetical protein
MVRRRRFFVRAQAAPDGSTEVTFGGLARSDAAGGLESEFAGLTDALRALHSASPDPASPDPASPDPASPDPVSPDAASSDLGSPVPSGPVPSSPVPSQRGSEQ